MIFDLNSNPILGDYNSVTKKFRISDYALNADWNGSNSGLYFEGIDASGIRLPMPHKSYTTSIDFSHCNGISYVSDHPTWISYEETDYNFLRAMGYSLVIDKPTYVAITDIEVTPGSVNLKFNSMIGREYQVVISTDLQNWETLAEKSWERDPKFFMKSLELVLLSLKCSFASNR